MLESSSFMLCTLNTSNCLILHGEMFLLFTFYHVIQFLYPMQWLILAGAIIEKRNMGIGPTKIQQPYPHHDKSFQITLDAVVVVMMVCVDLSND